MSGTLIIGEGEGARDKHCHLEIFFKDFRLTLRDPRMFGRVALFKDRDFSCLPGLDTLGPEPLSSGFNAEWLLKKFQGRKAPVKALLLDQEIGAGIGNIYSDEACYISGISPLRPAGKITKEEAEKLARAVKKVLNQAIRNMGCTIRDYKTSEGAGGDYRPLAYGRKDRKCHRCGGTIIRVTVGNRSSFYCPECQT
jgi:formamidopyrimidine-DNA glycosylase